IGLYGVVAQIVGQRTRELSVRLALGATPDRVIGRVAREGLLLLVVGIVAGAPLAYGAVRAISNELVGMRAPAATAWMIATVAIAIAMVLASVLPARRVAHLNPVDALRAD